MKADRNKFNGFHFAKHDRDSKRMIRRWGSEMPCFCAWFSLIDYGRNIGLSRYS
jgi:hypothetical protein